MWDLSVSEGPAQPFVHVGSFETTHTAARTVAKLEGYGDRGVFFEVLLGSVPDENDSEAFDHLDYTAKGSGRLYALRRVRH